MSEHSHRSPADQGWDEILGALRERYPGQKDSVLFCLHKLQQNAEFTLPDIRDEARLHGIPMAGRALHSAKVLMGLATTKPRRTRQASTETPEPVEPAAPTADEPVAASGRRRGAARATRTDGADSIENQVLDAVRQIQAAAGERNERLRLAVKQAIAMLQRALED